MTHKPLADFIHAVIPVLQRKYHEDGSIQHPDNGGYCDFGWDNTSDPPTLRFKGLVFDFPNGIRAYTPADECPFEITVSVKPCLCVVCEEPCPAVSWREHGSCCPKCDPDRDEL